MEKRNFLLSGVLTLFVIVVVILSGPAAAITIGVTDLANTVNGGKPVSFKTKVDLHKGDLIPQDMQLTLNVVNDKGEVEYSCVFNLDGTVVGPCSGLTVNLYNKDVLSQVGIASAFGFDGHDRTTLTDGYGYGYVHVDGQGYYNFSNVLGSSAEFTYDVVWNTPTVAKNTLYTITLTAQKGADFKFETSSNNAGRIMVFGPEKKK